MKTFKTQILVMGDLVDSKMSAETDVHTLFTKSAKKVLPNVQKLKAKKVSRGIPYKVRNMKSKRKKEGNQHI